MAEGDLTLLAGPANYAAGTAGTCGVALVSCETPCASSASGFTLTAALIKAATGFTTILYCKGRSSSTPKYETVVPSDGAGACVLYKISTDQWVTIGATDSSENGVFEVWGIV